MHVASLELCVELNDLSGWLGEKGDCWYDGKGRIAPNNIYVPAYSLGYLLRKLPDNIALRRVKDSPAYYCRYYYRQPYVEASADTPEDAMCKLAIELFKQGILKKEEL